MAILDPKKVKTRYWFCLVFIDAVYSDWEDRLRKLMLPVAISPLHIGDIDTGGKDHYHVIIRKNTTMAAMQNLFDTIYLDHGPRIEPCGDLPICYDYLIHWNDPEKQQFKEGYKAITCYNGFDLDKYRVIDSDDIFNGLEQIFSLIKKYKIHSMNALIEYLTIRHQFSLIRIVQLKSYYVVNLLAGNVSNDPDTARIIEIALSENEFESLSEEDILIQNNEL